MYKIMSKTCIVAHVAPVWILSPLVTPDRWAGGAACCMRGPGGSVADLPLQV